MQDHNEKDATLGSILGAALKKRDDVTNRKMLQRAINELVLSALKDRDFENPLGFLDNLSGAVGAVRVNTALRYLVGGVGDAPVYKVDNAGCSRPIDAIKRIRAFTGWGLKESKEFYEGSREYVGSDILELEEEMRLINVSFYRVR